jgi:hypothetical protein
MYRVGQIPVCLKCGLCCAVYHSITNGVVQLLGSIYSAVASSASLCSMVWCALKER